ncbi:BTAD domain-containing putative transcriptional regulator [Agromyces salentinus]|uniref:OmpR/PhoB-type domain-containing protein n=1 Tax=Agromyces salentinus TaxID=269421 RepID=A0ABN2N3M7_9MICO|nr:BTAD domain-containing putative transcriptional regulator [Agromyces salentinus]
MISNTTAIDHAGLRSGTASPARGSKPGGVATFVIGAAGSGKTEYARRVVAEASGSLVQATREWGDADVARRRLLDAAAESGGTLAVDDAQHLLGTSAEPVLEGFAAASGLDRLLVVSRRPPSFSVPRDGVVLAPDLALRLPDVAALFHDVTRRRIDLETASMVRRETAGWAQPVHELAADADATTEESLEAWIADTVGGDTASGWLEEVLGGLPADLVSALAATSTLPQLDLARVAGMLGRAGAVTLIGALDRGVVMHSRCDGGRRALPPILRRHLLRSMDATARAASASAACRLLMDEGAVEEAADTLAAGRSWIELEALLCDEGAMSGALWAEPVPGHILRRCPSIAAALESGRAGDRIATRVETQAAIPMGGRPGGMPLPPRTSVPPLHAALSRLRRGDVTGAVPLLRRLVRTAERADERFAARLALLVIRAPLATDEETLDGLVTVERQAVDHGLGGLGRVVRGALAALTRHPERGTVRRVCDQLEERGDVVGLGVVEAIDVLDRFRRGALETERAMSFAARCDRLGLPDVATWGRAVAAVGAATNGDPRASELCSAVDASTIRLHLPGPRSLLEAASAIRSGDPRTAASHASAARRSALETGLPRLPVSMPRRPRANARVRDQGGMHVSVACFGGFRLRLDGVDADLRLVRPQARMLLRMLALNAGAPLHRELIADLLWTDLGSESALHALHVSVSSLRRLVPGSGREGGIVERVGEAYRLGLTADNDCDLVGFDEHLSEAAIAKARREPAVARDRLVAALELYTGDVLPEDGPAEWAVGARDRYRHRASEAASSLAHLHAHFGEAHPAVAAARRAVEIDPWLDESWRTLVTMHERAGDVIAARRAQQGYRNMRQALGVE